MHTWYDLLHDFAGPVATVLAAGTALIVTWRFSSQQVATARQQADLASMRLQLDLYDRRFKVYNAAKSLLVALQREAIIGTETIFSFMIGTTDSIFLLDETTNQYLDELKSKALELQEAQGNIRETRGPSPSKSRAIEKEAELRNWFNAQFPILSQKFRPFLDLRESPLRS